MNINKKLLKWYDLNKRELPWRKKSHQDSIDPYYIWISEIMLQQTTVNTVVPYFEKFIKKFPNIFKLSNSSTSQVLKYWAGLGYYARARNIHKSAKIIVKKYKGIIPNNMDSLLELPGIGDYTAGAIITIAFNQIAFPIDVNIKRVVNRLSNNHGSNKTESTDFLKNNIAVDRPGDFIEALMDLGAQICKAKSPKCELCPLIKNCKSFINNKNILIYKKKINKTKIIKYGICFIIERTQDKKYFFIRMPEKGLYGGMLSFPTSTWMDDSKLLIKETIFNLSEFKIIKDKVLHSFSHFQLELLIYYKKDYKFNNIKGKWLKIDEARPQLSSLMRKVLDKFIC